MAGGFSNGFSSGFDIGAGGARLDARWLNFWARGQAWYHFWQDTSVAAGPVGSLSVTLDAATLASTAAITAGPVTGSLSAALDAVALSSTAAVSWPERFGVLTSTLGAATLVSGGSILIDGDLGSSLANASLVSTAAVAWTIPAVGVLTQTLGDAILAGTAAVSGGLAGALPHGIPIRMPEWLKVVVDTELEDQLIEDEELLLMLS